MPGSRSRPVDAAQRGARGHPRFAVRPYPKEWERQATLRDGTRDPGAADPAGGRGAVRGLLLRRDRRGSAAALLRPGHGISATPSSRASPRSTTRAPWRSSRIERSSGKLLGVVRLHANATYDSGEYAILVRSDLKGHGLGWLLMQTIIEYARSEGLRDDRRSGAARQHHDDRDVPRARLQRAGPIRTTPAFASSDCRLRPLRGPARRRPEAGRRADRRALRWLARADSARSRS